MNILKGAFVAIVMLLAVGCLDSDDDVVIVTISSKAELKSFRDKINSGKSDYYAILTQDINLDEEEWTPIGISYSYPYSGVFNGNGKSISGLKITSTEDYQGLFGYLDEGYVSNLTLIEPQVSGRNYVGAICGRVSNEGYIYVCEVQGGTISGTNYVGGMVGYSGATPLLDCTNSATVTGVSSVGGVAGSNSSSTVTNCNNSGIITATGEYSGGVVGYAYSSYITASYNSGGVTGTTYVGGVAGRISSTIVACYNTGDVEGTSGVGGIVGYVTNFYPDTYPTEVVSCYNSGSITYSTYAGALVGEVSDGVDFTSCYYLSTSASYGVGSTSSVEGAATDINTTDVVDSMNDAIITEDSSIGYLYTTGSTTPVFYAR